MNLLSSDPSWGAASIGLDSNSPFLFLCMLVSLLPFSIFLFTFYLVRVIHEIALSWKQKYKAEASTLSYFTTVAVRNV
jgi:hypothetical protein